MAINGLAGLIARLRQMQENIIPAAVAAVEVNAQEVCDMAKELCPVETGNLKNSITATVTRTETGCIANVSCGAPYGVYVEHGTVHTPARPFMYPAAKAYEAKIAREVAQAIREAMG